MDDFVRAGIIAFWFIFFLPVYSAENREPWPSAVKKAEQSIIQVINEGRMATGFVVRNDFGEAFVTTNIHATHNLILEPDSISNFKLINRKGKPLKFQGLEVFSVFPDLVLIKLKNYVGSSLPLADFDEEGQDAYVLGFPQGQFKQMKIWNIRSSGKINLDGITYSSEMPGTSGAPLLNKEGFVIGVLIGGDFHHSAFFSRSFFLKELLVKTREDSSIDLLESQLIKELTSLLSSAQNGDSEVQSRLGILYNEEEFLFYNPEEARKWEIRATENGDTRSQISMAGVYIGNKSYEKAGLLIKNAAEKGRNPQAMYYLSEFYRIGVNGFPKDPQKGLTWLIKAMVNNHPEAIKRMAEISLTGIGVPENIELGLRLLHILAERDFSPAQEVLSELGIPLSESVFWSRWTELNEMALLESSQAFGGMTTCVPNLFKGPEEQSD